MTDERNRIFFLGAGFSKAAGYPIASELWQEVRHRARCLCGRAREFQADLDHYLEYKRKCEDPQLTEERVDFEDFMGFLDVEHFLGLRGSDTWSSDGNEGTVVIKTLIGQILAEITPTPESIPEVHLKFAQGLQPGDYVVTLNYDTLLEYALEAVEKPYRLFATRLKYVNAGSAISDISQKEVVVLKLHGSIDWFDRTSYSETDRTCTQQGHATKLNDPVFAHTDEFCITKLLEGQRFPDDPLNQMYRVRHVRALYEKGLHFGATPWLLAPSSMKIAYAAKLKDFWRGMGRAGLWNFGLTIIGYSLPAHDEYARQILYSVVTNYQQNYWDEGILGMRETPLLIVDHRETPSEVAELKSRYRFVDWGRAHLHADGFNERAVELIHGKS